MATEQDSSRVSPAYRLIHHYRERAAAAIERYNNARVRGHVPETVQIDLASAALDYYHILYEHRDEEALDEPWEERGIDWLEEFAGTTVTVEESLPRANGATREVQKPAIQTVEPGRLKQVILELNDVANELGLSAEVKESAPRTDISEDLIEEVEEWRQANLE